jgi:hypothetical protein
MQDDQKLLPEARVAERYGVHSLTLSRWDQDPNLNFPRPFYIRGRKYRRASELDAFDERQREAS